jgi:ribonuclease-3
MTRAKKSIASLEQRIGHHFTDRTLIERALSHVSAVRGDTRVKSYQRLEFLGDHVLGLVISDMLFRAFPRADEGELSQRLSDLVRKETCTEVALAIDIGPHLRLGAGELRTGGRKKTAILADVCEAVIGAVFLDGGYAAAEKMVELLWRERMLSPQRPLRDAKTILQEWAQARGLPPPHYRETERRGPDHRPLFRIAVELPGIAASEGTGPTKRDAEQAAAAAMLARQGVAEAAGGNA